MSNMKVQGTMSQYFDTEKWPIFTMMCMIF